MKTNKEKFTQKYIIDENNCWLWTAAKNQKGYGYFGVYYQEQKKFKIKYAHRVSYEFYVGEIPSKLLVLHKCDVPRCVNPDHLFIGTDLDNAIDKIKKGRAADTKGEKNGRAILNKEKVLKIRKLYKTGKYSQVKLAEMFGVKKSIIGRILLGQAWSHV